MEDAHAAILDLQAEESTEAKPADENSRLSFFGVYDGHGGDKVALFSGETIHKIVAKQDAFKKGDIEQALKDGFLATDRAILTGRSAYVPKGAFACVHSLTHVRPTVRGGGFRLHCYCGCRFEQEDLRCMSDLCICRATTNFG